MVWSHIVDCVASDYCQKSSRATSIGALVCGHLFGRCRSHTSCLNRTGAFWIWSVFRMSSNSMRFKSFEFEKLKLGDFFIQKFWLRNSKQLGVIMKIIMARSTLEDNSLRFNFFRWNVLENESNTLPFLGYCWCVLLTSLAFEKSWKIHFSNTTILSLSETEWQAPNLFAKIMANKNLKFQLWPNYGHSLKQSKRSEAL